MYFLKFKAQQNAHCKISCLPAWGQMLMGQPEEQVSGNEDNLHFQKKQTKTNVTSTAMCGVLPMCWIALSLPR